MMPRLMPGLALALMLAPSALPGPERDGAWVRERVARVKRARNAAWDRVPWAANVIEGCRQSEKEGRPLFLFTHDGNISTGRC